MSSRASSEHTEREAEPDRAAQGSTEALHEVDRLLTLQRTVGNRAVNRLLARQGLLRNAPPEFENMSIGESDMAALVAFLESLTEDYDDA